MNKRGSGVRGKSSAYATYFLNVTLGGEPFLQFSPSLCFWQSLGEFEMNKFHPNAKCSNRMSAEIKCRNISCRNIEKLMNESNFG